MALIRAASVQRERVLKYANEDEPFENFLSSASFADTTVVDGIMTRVGDKFGRLRNVLTVFKTTGSLPANFSDESLDDTFDDIINYVNILRVWINTQGGLNYPDVPEVLADMVLGATTGRSEEAEVSPSEVVEPANVEVPSDEVVPGVVKRVLAALGGVKAS